jgi:hypothetical protein
MKRNTDVFNFVNHGMSHGERRSSTATLSNSWPTSLICDALLEEDESIAIWEVMEGHSYWKALQNVLTKHSMQ